MKINMVWAGLLALGCLAMTGCHVKEEAAVTQGAGRDSISMESGSSSEPVGEGTYKEIDELKIAFSPYQDADSIITATRPLEDMLRDKLRDRGYQVDKVTMNVGTSYEAVGEALSAGSADMGFLSGGAYVLYDEECEALLTAQRSAINKDSENPADWNDGTLEQETGEKATSYRSILLAGPSDKGQALIRKVNAGEELSWEDLNSATWAVMSPASASGYIYPSLWLSENYGKTIGDLDSVVQSDSYTTSLARLASRQADIMVSFGHIRIKNAPIWRTDLGGDDDIVVQTGVIGVTRPIYNDTISVSKSSPIMDEDFKKALGESLIEIGSSKEGQDVISVFSQKGYEWAEDSNYDGEREAQKMLRDMQ